MTNPNCTGSRCQFKNGEVRLLGQRVGIVIDSYMILCRECFDFEILWRKQRNKSLLIKKYELPTWEELKVRDE